MKGRATWHTERADAVVRRSAMRGLEHWADDVLAAAEPLVPVAPDGTRGAGFLRDSGKVSISDEGELAAAVSYDSPPKHADGRASSSGSLAIWVHENLKAKHATGQAKFLEKALQVRAPAGLARLAAALREGFR